MEPKRQSVTIPSIQAGINIAGVKVSPDVSDSTSRRPAVILAHGVACTMEYGIAAYAKAFASAGYHAVLFDYRGWGKSQGVKYSVIFKEQHEDIRSVAKWAKQQDGVDPERIVLWGSSLGAAHCLHVASQDSSSYEAVICCNPFTSGLSTLIRSLRPWTLLYAMVGIVDAIGSIFGLKPITVRCTQDCNKETGAFRKFSRGVLVAGDTPKGFWTISSGSHFPDANHIHARNLLQLLHYEPWLNAAKVKVPILFTPINGKEDLTPQFTAARAAKKAAKGEFKQVGSSKTNHFSVYKPGMAETCFEESCEAHLEFLKRVVPL